MTKQPANHYTTTRRPAPDWSAIARIKEVPHIREGLLPLKEGPRFMSNAEWLSHFKTPDWIIDDVLPRGDLYALTGHAKTGKTAAAQAIAMHVATGLAIGPHSIPKGRVLYLAGENPDNIRKRWVVMTEDAGLSSDLDVHWYDGEGELSKVVTAAETYTKNIGKDFDLVVVDTKTAYSEGEDENTTEDAMEDARGLRRLTGLPGNPHVLTLCHPAGGAKKGNMTPRGGKAFMGAIDGNIEAWNLGKQVELICTKAREAPFEAMFFDFKNITSATRKDAKGRPIKTFMVTPAPIVSTTPRSTEDELDAYAEDLLRAMAKQPCLSFADYAVELGWVGESGPIVSRVRNKMMALKDKGLVAQICPGDTASYAAVPAVHKWIEEHPR